MQGLRFLIALSVISTAMFAAENNPFIGTWKLNVAKSTFAAGTAPKEETVTFAAAEDQMKRTLVGIDADGQKFNASSTIPWDGEAHTVEEQPNPPIMMAVTKVNDHTLDVTAKLPDGKLLYTIKAVVSPDRNSISVIQKGENLKGRKLDTNAVFEKQ